MLFSIYTYTTTTTTLTYYYLLASYAPIQPIQLTDVCTRLEVASIAHLLLHQRNLLVHLPIYIQTETVFTLLALCTV